VSVTGPDAATSESGPRTRSLTKDRLWRTRHDWADDDELEETTTTNDLPPPQKIQNKDGTWTIIEYRLNDAGQKVKATRRVRYVVRREVINPRVAERKTWAKFGDSAKDPPGPVTDTTTVGENIIFRPSVNWRREAKDEANDPNAQAMKDKLRDKKVKCRICDGEHFTARCPYKDTMAPIGESGAADVAAGVDELRGAAAAAGAAGPGKKGSYVPPALRNRAEATGERMGGKYGDRDDLATLRVTNVGFLFLRHTRLRGPSEQNKLTNQLPDRFPRWLRSTSCASCSSGSAVLRASSWPRTATRVWPRASPSSALPIARTPSRPVKRWTVSVSATLFSGSSSRRRLSRWS
jgi:translation initiation factor 3 subunit G